MYIYLVYSSEIVFKSDFEARNSGAEEVHYYWWYNWLLCTVENLMNLLDKAKDWIQRCLKTTIPFTYVNDNWQFTLPLKQWLTHWTCRMLYHIYRFFSDISDNDDNRIILLVSKVSKLLVFCYHATSVKSPSFLLTIKHQKCRDFWKQKAEFGAWAQILALKDEGRAERSAVRHFKKVISDRKYFVMFFIQLSPLWTRSSKME